MTKFEKMNQETIDQRADTLACLMLCYAVKLFFPGLETESVKEWKIYGEVVHQIKELLQEEVD